MSRVILASLAVAALPLMAPRAASAAELVPSVGLTRSVDSDETKSQIGIALRGSVVPGLLQSELGVGYRKDEVGGGGLELRQIPVTASLLLTPIPTLHGDAGVGWYNTRYDYQDPLLKDETKQKFGVHVGGGFKIPIAPVAALDVTGRYVFLEKQESRLIPSTFDPDYWTLSLGLAFRL
jgi:opacity protein-like surface antigen